MRLSGIFFVQAKAGETIDVLVNAARILSETKDEDIGIERDEGKIVIPAEYFRNVTDDNLVPLVDAKLRTSEKNGGVLINIGEYAP